MLLAAINFASMIYTVGGFVIVGLAIVGSACIIQSIAYKYL